MVSLTSLAKSLFYFISEDQFTFIKDFILLVLWSGIVLGTIAHVLFDIRFCFSSVIGLGFLWYWLSVEMVELVNKFRSSK